MAKPYLCVPNLIDTTTYTVNFTGGSWNASYPLTNLAHPKLYKVARSTDATTGSTTLDVALGATRNVRLVGIPKHNLSRSATIRVRGGTDATFALTNHDSGTVTVWATLTSPGYGQTGDFLDTNSQLSPEVATDYNVGFVDVATTAYSASYLRIGITDTTNTDGYVQLHRLFVASAWDLSVYGAPGMQWSWLDDNTIIERSKGGVDFADDRPKRRRVLIAFDGVTGTDARLLALSIQRQVGRSGQIYFVLDADQATQAYQTAFLGTLKEVTPVEWTMYDHTKVQFVVEEVL